MKVIILSGLPGSGKTTICKDQFRKYRRINQDLLGSKEACIDAFKICYKHSQDIIIDRCNTTKKQRKTWIDLALQCGADTLTAIYLDVNADECIARVHARKDHETIKETTSFDKKRIIVYNFEKELEKPEISEGFTAVLFIRN
jgi:atypical dual specificity phosphatase